MHLHEGCEEEYKRRHDALWLRVDRPLKQTGIREYSLFLDESTNDLFGYLTMADPGAWTTCPRSRAA